MFILNLCLKNIPPVGSSLAAPPTVSVVLRALIFLKLFTTPL